MVGDQLYFGAVNPQQIERRLLSSSARRDRSRLDDQRGMPFDPVTLGGPRCVTQMKMTGKKKVRVRLCQFRHRHSRAAEEPALLHPGREIEGVVRHDDTNARGRRGGETFDDPIHLAPVDASFAVGERPGRVDPNDNHLFIFGTRARARVK